MASATLTLFIGSLLLIVYKVLFHWYKIIRYCKNYPSHCVPLPIIGHGYIYLNVSKEDIIEKVQQIVQCDEKHRKLAMCIGNCFSVWYYHPEPVEEILSSSSMITKSDDYVYLIVSKFWIFQSF